jgi:Domain of unknown function (DUF1905)
MPGIPVCMKFSTTMFQMRNNTGIDVPADVVAALDAGKRPPVVVNVNGYEYRSTAVLDAKKAETRTRRIAAVLAKLEG